MRKLVNLGGSALAALAFAGLATESTLAHRPITSKYTYNADVFPIVRDRCGRCHVAGGAAPMSLLSYKDAVPWEEWLREELTAERMPAWYVDEESAPIRGGRSLTAREIDTIVTWATGGTPEGDAAKRPAPVSVSTDWPAGPPDLVIAMDAGYTVPAETQDETATVTLATGRREPRWGKAAGLRPGTPSMVLADQTTVVAIRPELDRPYAAIDVHALLAGGGGVPLLRLRAPRPEWARRYWLASPVDLPRGSRIEVVTTAASTGAEAFPADPDVSGRGAAAPPPPGGPGIPLDCRAPSGRRPPQSPA